MPSHAVRAGHVTLHERRVNVCTFACVPTRLQIASVPTFVCTNMKSALLLTLPALAAAGTMAAGSMMGAAPAAVTKNAEFGITEYVQHACRGCCVCTRLL